MEYEIELKLLTSQDAGDIIEKKLLPQLNASITQQTLVLTNHYFDTPDRKLRQNDIGLRIRGFNQKYEQTLKTAGKSIGGLHQRPEYNVDLDESKQQSVKVPNLRLFPRSAWPESIEVDDIQSEIETLFTTHFHRSVYLLEYSQGDVVELVWDLGEIESGGKSIPICELELELKQGDTKILFDLAESIVAIMPTSIGTQSKAARGYRLLDGFPAKTFRQYQPQTKDNTPNSAQEFSLVLTENLQFFQMLSVEIQRQYSEQLANDITLVLGELSNSLFKFTQHFPCEQLDTILSKVRKLRDDWLLGIQQKNKVAANNILTNAQTTQLQLDIVQYLVEQPWVSTVVE
ncbi:MAG: CYTH domain-containing protein [Paraglaciecola sp.]|uniref:CYTH domain-containing protein n=1 Tax=Paraglaciecola sp. TaxID=1920173 RepID=UPI003299A285